MVTDIICCGDCPRSNFFLFLWGLFVKPPRIWRWLRSLISSGSWRRVFWQSFVKVHPTRPNDTSVCPVYATNCMVPYFGKVFEYRTFPGTVPCGLLTLSSLSFSVLAQVTYYWPASRGSIHSRGRTLLWVQPEGIWDNPTLAPKLPPRRHVVRRLRMVWIFPLLHFLLWLQSTVHRLNTGNFFSCLVDNTKWDICKAVCTPPPPPPDAHTVHCRGIFCSKWYRYQNLSHLWRYWTHRH